MQYRVENNLTIGEACKLAGYSEAGWYLAMKRPHVAQELENMVAAYIAKASARREYMKARAYHLAEELLETAETKAEKWKGVEFWTREGPKAGAQVVVNVESPGYAYRRPGERLVDVTPMPTDAQSDGQDDESPQNKGDDA